jgi:soluble lytic murein transglycosylase-like protein
MEAMQLYRDITALWSRLGSAVGTVRRSDRIRELRRPAARFVIGGGLIVPAAVLMAGTRTESGPEPVSIPQVLEAEATEARVPASRFAEAVARWTEQEVAPAQNEREAAPEWAGALELAASGEEWPTAEPRLAVATFAREFRIPVTLAAQIHSAALAANIKPRIAFGLVKAESSFRTKAVSPVGAVGLTQLLPSTARWLVPGTTRRDLMVPQTNLRVGFKYLRHLIDQYDGNEKLALTAYNRGPGTVSKLLKRGRNPDNGYAEKVLTGSSTRHVRLMNAKFGRRRG